MATYSYRDPVSGNYVPLLDEGLNQARGDARYINLAGDTATGAITVPAPTADAHLVDQNFVLNLVPPGIIAALNTTTPATGWLTCNGASYPKATYPDLYAVIGTTHGGDANNFNVPNLKACLVVGVDTGQGEFNTVAERGGEPSHTISAGEAFNAAGGINWHGAGSRTSFYGASGTFYNVGYIGAYGRPQYWQQAATNIGGANYNYGGGGGAHENQQPFMVLAYAIKV